MYNINEILCKHINKEPKLENVYHYSGSEAMLNILKGNSIHMSLISLQNDLLEIKHTISLLEEMKDDISNIINDDVILKDFNTEIKNYKRYLERKSRVYTFSVSNKSDSLTCWSEYTNKLGYCIGINFDKINKQIENFCEDNKMIAWLCGNVIYDPKEQKKILKLVIKKLSEEVKGKRHPKSTEIIGDFVVAIYFLSYFMKCEALVEEDEYRFVIHTSDNIPVYFKNKQNITIPYIIVDGDFSDCYREIIIGPLEKRFTKESLKLYLKHELNEKNEKMYKLNVEDINIDYSRIKYRW
ncbi:MAG: DUF2971 domain-containing protein [Vallitalea sp.]|jgi:hypothetical protein|nr:DUF2971 domain-containing protein [Vallitalea sp.]